MDQSVYFWTVSCDAVEYEISSDAVECI